MTDLILKIQLATVKKNLEQIKDFRKFVKKQSVDIQELCTIRESIWESVKKINGEISTSKSDIEFREQEEEFEEVIVSLNSIQEEIKKIRRYLRSTNDIIKSMQAQFIGIGATDEEDTISRRAADLAGRTAIEMEKEADNCIEDLKRVLRIVERAGGEGRSDAEDLRKQAWKEYEKGIYKKSQELFDDYVEFLSGLALRDTGFDNKVCQIADYLICKCKVEDLDHTLTIPTRQEAVTKTLARIIRLGFPEWTIWTLPLTAHEFGHVLADENNELKAFINQKVPNDESKLKYHMQDYVADIFATYSMGPAYACAAILLRFNPLLAYVEGDKNAADANRALVVFTLLDWMKSISSEYTFIINTLKEEWSTALQQAEPLGTLETQNENPWEDWVRDITRILKSQAKGIQYSPEGWSRAKKLGDQLLNAEIKEISLGTADMRDVLNAAWLCRIENQNQVRNIGEEQRQAEAIARVVLDLWHRIAYRKQTTPRSEISQRKVRRMMIHEPERY